MLELGDFVFLFGFFVLAVEGQTGRFADLLLHMKDIRRMVHPQMRLCVR